MAFLEDMNNDEDNAPVFKLIDIAVIYKVRLEQLGRVLDNRIHTTILKNRLLSALPGLKAHSQGRDTLLIFFRRTLGQPLWVLFVCHALNASSTCGTQIDI